MIREPVTLATIPRADGKRLEWSRARLPIEPMPTLLLNLRHVPDDEAEEVRALLADHHIGYYETPPSRWGISMGGIWVRDSDQAEQARRLLDEYQARRANRAREDYDQRRRAGTAETLVDRFRRDPVRMLLFTAIAAGLFYFLVYPFFGIGGG